MEQGFLELKDGRSVPYRVERSARRRRSYALRVAPDGVVVFQAPRWVGVGELLRFGASRHRFIGNRLDEHDRKAARHAAHEALAHRVCPLPDAWFKQAAQRLMPPRLRVLADEVGVTVGRIQITSGKTVWGSCASTGDINLSWRLMQVPADLRDYVLYHELCHRRYMSHGPRFWALVGRFVPDYVAKRRALNALGGEIG